MNRPGQENSTQAAVVPVQYQQPPWNRDRRIWLVAVPLASIVVYAFLPVLDNDFVPMDDDFIIVGNPHIRGLSAANVKWAWTSLFIYYQPLANMLFAAQYVIWQLDPRGYHLTSLLLQVATALVLYVFTVDILARCGNDCRIESPWPLSLSAGLATALFAVHPLRVAVVAWATVQTYLPCAIFSMLAVLAYLRAFPRHSPARWGWWTGSLLLYVAALLFLPAAVSLPVVLLILDVYPLRRFPDGSGRWFGASTVRILLEKVPFVMVSFLFMGLAIAGAPYARVPADGAGTSAGIARACYATMFYLLKTVLPLNDASLYLPPSPPSWLALPFAVSILATLAISAGLFLLRRRWPGLLAAWLCYLVILAPTSGFVSRGVVFVGDRYSYFAMLSSVTPAAAGFCRLWRISAHRRFSVIAISAVGLGTLLGLTAMTRGQCRLWRNVDTLAAYGMDHGANSISFAHSTFGILLYTQKRYEAAAAQFTEALRLNPADASSHINLGACLVRRGKHAEAAAHFAEAARLNPEYEPAHSNWGKVLYDQGNYEESVTHLTEALRLNPGATDVHNSLGVVLDKQGKFEEALTHFTEAVRLNPGFADARNNLATLLASRGKYAEAEAQYAEVARLNPLDDKARNNLGKVLFKEGKNEEAVAHFTEALRLNPGSIDAHYNLGLVFSHLGNYEAARAQYAEAIRLQPEDPRSFNASAMIMASCPDAKFRDGKKAVELAARACDLTQWKNPIILDTLAAAQAEAGDFEAAVKSQKQAIQRLTDERQKADYRSRLVLYQAKRPYR